MIEYDVEAFFSIASMQPWERKGLQSPSGFVALLSGLFDWLLFENEFPDSEIKVQKNQLGSTFVMTRPLELRTFWAIVSLATVSGSTLLYREGGAMTFRSQPSSSGDKSTAVMLMVQPSISALGKGLVTSRPVIW